MLTYRGCATRPGRQPSRVNVRDGYQRAVFDTLESRRFFSIVNATADAFVRDGSFAAANFGAAPLLYSKNAPGDTREAYVKFDVSGAGSAGTAIFRFDAKLQSDSTPDTRVGIFAVADTSWIEGNGTTTDVNGDGNDTDNSPAGELTFNNRPTAASTQPIDIITISGGVQQSYALDVSTVVHAQAAAGHSVVGFVIRSLDTGADFVEYVSREDPNFGPQLDVSSEAGPTSSLSASNIITPAGATSSVVVNYADPEEVEFQSLSNDDITVLDPNGHALTVSHFSSTPSATASTLAVTYTIQAPGGSWDDTDAGTYVVRLNAGQVSDAFDNFAPPGALGSFVVGPTAPPSDDGIGPAAALGDVPSVLGGAVTLQFNVTYTDDTAVDASDAAPTNLIITKAGSSSPLTIRSALSDSSEDAPTRTFTYVIDAPGGVWDAADNGDYTIAVADDQVSDTAGHFATTITLGTFNVNLTDDGGRTLKGAFGSAGGKTTNFTLADADGTIVTFSLKGGGSGQVFEHDGAYDIDLAGVSVSSSLSIRTRGGDGSVRLGSVTGDALKSISAKTADLAGAITLNGPIGNLQLGNITDSSLACGPGGIVAIQTGAINNFSINSASAIKSIRAASWSDDGAADSINAPSLGTMTVHGVFAADIITESIGMLKAGTLMASIVRATDAIGKVAIGAMDDSAILAGITGGGNGLPDSMDDFANPAASIASVAVKTTFSSASIAAPTIGKVTLGVIQTANGGTTFGVAGDHIASVIGTANGARSKASALDAPSQSQTLQDFTIRLI